MNKYKGADGKLYTLKQLEKQAPWSKAKMEAYKAAVELDQKSFHLVNQFDGNGTYICSECGKRTRNTGRDEASVLMCSDCYEKAQKENLENDHPSRPGHRPGKDE